MKIVEPGPSVASAAVQKAPPEASHSASEFTALPLPGQPGGSVPAEELLALAYQELRRLAAIMMSREAPGQTLQPTALVHEAWLRLAAENKAQPWAGRNQFFAAAAEAMRRILIENARRKSRRKRGGGWQRVQLEGLTLASHTNDLTLLVVDQALESLAVHDPPKANLVKLRFYGGLTAEESAPVLGVSVPTVKRHWQYARAWLLEEIERIIKQS